MSNKWPGVIYNHSQIPLYVVETDTGPARVHILGAKMKSPHAADADGFKRADGQSILGHKQWWKIIPLISVDIYQIGQDFLAPVSLIRPVPDDQFGQYKIMEEDAWGVNMAYVTGTIRNKRNLVTHYETDTYGTISREKGLTLASEGKLDNVVVVTASKTSYLRAKPNTNIKDNIG